MDVEIEAAHAAACAQGRDGYTDPRTGLFVFTELAALRRGTCCGRGCRHCPYAHANVADHARRRNVPREPVLVRGRGSSSSSSSSSREATERLNVLFWSGGKDSFLTLAALKRSEPDADVVLLTTFDASTRMVPEQNVPMDDVLDQATKGLGLDLVLVPLPSEHVSNDAYLDAVVRGIAAATSSRSRPFNVRLVFGDLHLADIRAWREAAFASRGFSDVCFPLFGASYADLSRALFTHDRVAKVTFTNSPSVALRERLGVRVGDAFDAAAFERLSKDFDASGDVDPFGERGEFHTFVQLT